MLVENRDGGYSSVYVKAMMTGCVDCGKGCEICPGACREIL